MNIVIVGHVDHGKSTIIGRLLADTGSLPEGRLEQVQAACRARGQAFEYAYLLDALKDEQAQGITIDAARCFFKSERRDYLIIDAPGHVEFLKNMVTGAARAEAALLVIDASEGVQENSRRHAYMLSLLGIDQVAVLINKMDLVGYDEAAFRHVEEEFSSFLSALGLKAATFIPVSGKYGDNIATPSRRLPWYTGEPVLAVLDRFRNRPQAIDKPFRMPVQGVYRFNAGGDRRRIIAGTVVSGRLKVGDTVVFYPSGKASRVKSIEVFPARPIASVEAGMATGFTLEEQIYIRRGEVATVAGEPAPVVTDRIRADLFWLGKRPMRFGHQYCLKIGTARVGVVLQRIVRVINASNLQPKPHLLVIERHDVAECILKLAKPVAVEYAGELPELARFVIVDDYEISGGGLVRQSLPAEPAESPGLTCAGQSSVEVQPDSLRIVLAGLRGEVPLWQVAAALEQRLLADADRVSLLVTAVSSPPLPDELSVLQAACGDGGTELVWIGDAPETWGGAGFQVAGLSGSEAIADRIYDWLQARRLTAVRGL